MTHHIEQLAAMIKQQVSSGQMLFEDAKHALVTLGVGSTEAHKYLIGGKVRRENVDIPEKY